MSFQRRQKTDSPYEFTISYDARVMQWFTSRESRRKASEVAALAHVFTRSELIEQFEECKRQIIEDPIHLGKYTERIDIINRALEFQATVARNAQ